MDKLYKDNKSSLRDPKLLKELILAYLKKDNQKNVGTANHQIRLV